MRYRRIRSAASALRFLVRTPPWLGSCPLCRKPTVFFAVGEWLREDLKCLRCRSSSRQRAVASYLSRTFGDLGTMRVHEPSPTIQSVRFFSELGARYTWSRYSADVDGGTGGDPPIEDLESLSYPDDSFDLVVSQDVFEHLDRPRRAFAEISRVLRPGGSHVFTVPWYPDRTTKRTAEKRGSSTRCFQPPEYHSDPFDERGSLVFTMFGSDIGPIIERSSGMKTTIVEARDRRLGIWGDSVQVFHSRKPL